jgi:hypothetical protein
MMRRFLFLPLLWLIATSPASAALRAWVDNPQVAPGETFALTLAHDGHTRSEPDLAPLRQDFDIVSRSTSSNIQIVNGSISSTTQLTLTLAPRRAGPLIIPSISWDSDRSTPLTINVSASTGNPAAQAGANGSRVFLETEVEPKSAYVQAAVHVTVKVYAAVPLSHADLEFSASDAAQVRQVGSDTAGTSDRNGQAYQVVTRHYLIFPQHSGHLSLPGPVLSGNVPAGLRAGNPNDPFSQFFGNNPFGGLLGVTKPIRLNSQPIELDVQPRPSGAGGNYWLPAQNVKLTARWRPENLQARVGDPLTVTLDLQAEDLTAAQLPDLSTLLALPDGLKAYPDEPKLKDTASGSGLTGEREQNIALIADQPGHFTIPELRLSWWDTRANQARQAVLPAQTLIAAPAPGSPSNAPVTQQTTAAPTANPVGNTAAPTISNLTTSPFPWQWISLGLGLLWLATLAGWLMTRGRGGRGGGKPASQPTQQTLNAPGKSAAHAAFLAACKANDPSAARRNLLAWANGVLPEQRIPGLNALAKIIGNEVVADLLRTLDRACYAGKPWDGAALAHVFRKWPTRGTGNTGPEQKLAQLYR